MGLLEGEDCWVENLVKEAGDGKVKFETSSVCVGHLSTNS